LWADEWAIARRATRKKKRAVIILAAAVIGANERDPYYTS